MLKWLRKGLLAGLAALLLLAAGYSDYRPSSFELTVVPYKYSVAQWEATHFLDKWAHKLWDLMPWTSEPSRQERVRQVQEYFDLGTRLRKLERQLQSSEQSGPTDEVRELRVELGRVKQRRKSLQTDVEETIESEINAVLAQEGFASRTGLTFPPVDTVFSRSPGALILSPRDRIHRQETVLMKPGLSDETRDQIEERILRDQDLAAVIEDTGGVAAFPSVVSGSGSLQHAVVTTAHEWLHHWFFFQPLGQGFWESPEMTTLNETAATMAGREIGDRAYSAITGQPVFRNPPSSQDRDPSGFDFHAAMRETRLQTEELLAQGKVEAAEAYMEERRKLMAVNGWYIRKINQAFFAFHGSYATSAASISPIADQLDQLRSRSDSVEDFIKTVAGFGSYPEFLEHLEALDTPTGNCHFVPLTLSVATRGSEVEGPPFGSCYPNPSTPLRCAQDERFRRAGGAALRMSVPMSVRSPTLNSSRSQSVKAV